jgi:predicted transcriptional regulator
MTVPHPSDVRALHSIADQLAGSRSLLVAQALSGGVEPEALRNLQLEGLAEVLDDQGHPAIFITERGRAALRRQPSLFST